MLVSSKLVKLNAIAKEILLAQSFLALAGRKITYYSITKRINEVRENNDNFKTISHKTVKQYMESNLKIKEIK